MNTINQALSSTTSKVLLAFLTPRDFYRLMLTSKSVYKQLQEQEGVLVKHFLNQLVSDQDDLIVGIYKNPSYTSALRSVNETYHNSSRISENYKAFCSAKYQLRQFLETFSSTENAMNIINEALLKPLLMPLPIRRDFQSCETFSLFQNHLNDAYHQLIAESQPNEDNSEEVATFDPTTLSVEDQSYYNGLIFRAYWLMDVEHAIKREETSIPPIISAYIHLNRIFTSYCRLVAAYLDSITDSFIFISEYGCKWNNFVVSMQAIGGFLREFSQAMNTMYDERFKEYPNFPGFSIWRMMTKIWYAEVFSKLESKMVSSFKTTLTAYFDASNSGEKTIEFDDDEVEASLRMLFNSAIDFAVHEVSVSQLTFSSDVQTAKPTAQLFSSTLELFTERWRAISERADLRANQKYKIIKADGELLENIIPHSLFLGIYQRLAKAKQAVLVDFFSQAKLNVTNEEIVNFVSNDEGRKNIKILRWLGTDEQTLSYPELMRHVDACKDELEGIEYIVEYRAKKLQESRKPEVVELQKRLLDLHDSVDMELQEQCREFLKNKSK